MNYSFLDMDECRLGTYKCAHTCHNSIGSYICTCDSGFIINMDGKTCVGERTIATISIASCNAILCIK